MDARNTAGDVLAGVGREEGERLRSLASMARALSITGSVLEVVERAVEESCRVVQADSGTVSVLDRAAGLVRVIVNVGDLGTGEQRYPRDETYSLAEFPALEQVVVQQRAWTCCLADQYGDPHELDLLRQLGKGASMGAPVVVDGEIWGELYLTRHSGRPGFGPEDLAYAEALAAILAAGVSRAVHESALVELAYQDPLTGLANRRRLDEMAQGMVHGLADLVVVCIDVNGLKPVNDRRGHDAGDRLLTRVGRALARAAAALPGAVAARTGGDEFALIVPTSDVAQVDRAVQRFIVEVTRIPHPQGVSCGGASALAPISSPRPLFAAADRAMYHAKAHRMRGVYWATDPRG